MKFNITWGIILLTYTWIKVFANGLGWWGKNFGEKEWRRCGGATLCGWYELVFPSGNREGDNLHFQTLIMSPTPPPPTLISIASLDFSMLVFGP